MRLHYLCSTDISEVEHVKGGAILSAPNAPAQIDGHYGKLHSNWVATKIRLNY